MGPLQFRTDKSTITDIHKTKKACMQDITALV